LLNVGGDEIAVALRDFVASNRVGRNGDAYRGSVIVQRMIEADYAGVCLTRDGRTGHRDAVIIEMAAGGNTGVTGGTLRPDRVVVDRLTGDIVQDERRCVQLRPRVLDIAGMVQQFLTLEAHFGKSLDIEWALADRELYILQARPIVAGGVGPNPDHGV
jgi:pyruvate,water dikinase